MQIGILALQGGYQAHANCVNALGVSTRFVRKKEDFTDIDGLILPGGESSTLLKLIETFDLVSALKDFQAKKKPIYGTCAGMILLAKTVVPQQFSLGAIDISVARNAYGRQIDSFIAMSDAIESPDFGCAQMECVFIRAPRVQSVGEGVTTLLRYRAEPILVRQDHILAGSFHPELSQDRAVHQYFLAMISAS